MTEVMRSEVKPGTTEVVRSQTQEQHGRTEAMRSNLETKRFCWRKRALFTQHDRSRAKKIYLKSDNELTFKSTRAIRVARQKSCEANQSAYT